jgi:hypothetical protein
VSKLIRLGRNLVDLEDISHTGFDDGYWYVYFKSHPGMAGRLRLTDPKTHQALVQAFPAVEELPPTGPYR